MCVTVIISKEDNPHLNQSLWDPKNPTMRSRDRVEGWGWISASAATMIGWGMVVALGQEPNFGILFGSMGMGIWKMWRNGRVWR